MSHRGCHGDDNPCRPLRMQSGGVEDEKSNLTMSNIVPISHMLMTLFVKVCKEVETTVVAAWTSFGYY